MSGWERIPAIESLLAEINAVGPGRDKRSDGTVGDLAHSREASDHNPDDTPGLRTPGTDRDDDPEVHALDVTTAGPWRPRWSLYRIFQILADEHRAGRLDVLQNLILNGRIASRSWGWTWKVYDGSDPHREHGHVSFRYGSGAGSGNPENYPGPWGILAAYDQEETDMANPDDIAAATWNATLGKGSAKETTGQKLAQIDQKTDELAAGSDEMRAAIDAIETKLEAAVGKLADVVDVLNTILERLPAPPATGVSSKSGRA